MLLLNKIIYKFRYKKIYIVCNLYNAYQKATKKIQWFYSTDYEVSHQCHGFLMTDVFTYTLIPHSLPLISLL